MNNNRKIQIKTTFCETTKCHYFFETCIFSVRCVPSILLTIVGDKGKILRDPTVRNYIAEVGNNIRKLEKTRLQYILTS